MRANIYTHILFLQLPQAQAVGMCNSWDFRSAWRSCWSQQVQVLWAPLAVSKNTTILKPFLLMESMSQWSLDTMLLSTHQGREPTSVICGAEGRYIRFFVTETNVQEKQLKVRKVYFACFQSMLGQPVSRQTSQMKGMGKKRFSHHGSLQTARATFSMTQLPPGRPYCLGFYHLPSTAASWGHFTATSKRKVFLKSPWFPTLL